MSQMSTLNIVWYVANVSFSNGALGRTFKLKDFTSLNDIKDEIHYLLPYRDNRKIKKIEYRSPSFGNREKIEFSKFELKTQADVWAMWNTFFRFETKISFELEARISRSIGDILKMLKRPPEY